MDRHDKEEMDYAFWSKKILYFYWLLVIILIGGQIVGLIVTLFYFPDYTAEYIAVKMVLPISLLLIVVLVWEFLVKFLKIFNPIVLLFAGTLLSLVVILSNPNMPGLQLSLLLPMAISLIYLDKTILFASFAINFIGLLLVQLFSHDVRDAISPYEYSTYLFGLCAGFIVYLAVIERGSEVLNVLREANEKEQELLVKNKVMERVSKTDALTGLYNHKTFHEYMDAFVEKAAATHMPLQLAVLDVDNFKKVNDDFGHSAGDVVLKKVAETLLEKATGNDVVARYGGEEFAILFTGKSFQETMKCMEEMRKAVAELEHPGLLGRKVTISVGLQNFQPNLAKSEFFNKADALLYDAKKSGKNKVVHGRKLEYSI
ncbi:diguanylate cyclase [Planococcus sp. YIM B11945]|uniref:diguanylate cyclase n=1 Tax=Planococcus sp. YIM B11945 TaxID=3435410 RepID=UPI003D7DC2F6